MYNMSLYVHVYVYVHKFKYVYTQTYAHTGMLFVLVECPFVYYTPV